ncbi:hypothetical protein EI94DRAFT_1710298 [Lactarius quietus]|nr:hypothetical protein EI94DRAFT_1710298 [Lactarius quietus]
MSSKYRECALSLGGHIDDAWYEQCIKNEMYSMNEVFDEHERDNPGTPYPRIHTVIEFISEECWCKVLGQTEEEKELDFSAFSISCCLERINALRAQQPNLRRKLMMTNLPTLLQFQVMSVKWWLPGTLDFNDEDVDELSGDNPPPPPNEDIPMDEDKGDQKTPQMSHTWKHMIVTLPSEDLCGPCKVARAKQCLPQPAEKKNVTACPACTIKKCPYSPPPSWASKIGSESVKVESAPVTSKSTRKWTAVVILEDMALSLDRVERTIQVDGAEFRDRLSNIEAYLHLLAGASGVDLSSLNRTPPVPLFNTPSVAASCASTPLSINGPHISTLSIQETPGAGPSRISTKAEGTEASLKKGKGRVSLSTAPSVPGSQASSHTV